MFLSLVILLLQVDFLFNDVIKVLTCQLVRLDTKAGNQLTAVSFSENLMSLTLCTATNTAMHLMHVRETVVKLGTVCGNNSVDFAGFHLSIIFILIV